jgi:arylsulfatase I/J
MLALCLLAASVGAARAAAPPAAKPNLVFALIDDWGWFNNGFHGNALIKTPFMDKLVKEESAQIERHYAFKFCSPTRRAFLSGRVPPHSGQSNAPGATVDLRMTTIAAKLSAAGYVTGQAGKWHAGHFVMKQTPLGVGFHSSLGYFNGACDHWSQQDSEDGCQRRYNQSGPTVDLWNTDKPGVGLNGEAAAGSPACTFSPPSPPHAFLPGS